MNNSEEINFKFIIHIWLEEGKKPEWRKTIQYVDLGNPFNNEAQRNHQRETQRWEYLDDIIPRLIDAHVKKRGIKLSRSQKFRKRKWQNLLKEFFIR